MTSTRLLCVWCPSTLATHMLVVHGSFVDGDGRTDLACGEHAEVHGLRYDEALLLSLGPKRRAAVTR